MVVFSQLSPQLVVSRSTLTRPSSMNNHKALRGADFFCTLYAAKEGYVASSHSLKYCQSILGDRLSVHLPNRPSRENITAWVSFE